MNIPKLLIDTSISVAFTSFFICIFFFTYGKIIEKQVVVNNVNYIMDDLLGSAITIIPDNMKSVLKQQLNSINPPNMIKQDKIVSDTNYELIKKSIIIFSLFLVLVLVVGNVASKYYNVNYSYSIYQNMILLFFIGLTEYIFLSTLAKHYISAEPNLVVHDIIEMLKKK